MYPAPRTEAGKSIVGSVLAGRIMLSIEGFRERPSFCALEGVSDGLEDIVSCGDVSGDGNDSMVCCREGGITLTSVVGEL